LNLFYLVGLIFIISFFFVLDEALAGASIGDGMIEAGELSIDPTNSGFVNGEGIQISQPGNVEDATGVFNDLNKGTIEGNELSIFFNYVSGFSSQNIVIDNGVSRADGFWLDLNGDTIVDNGEITITDSEKFPNSVVLISRSEFAVILAAADFVDEPRLEDGELTITNNGAGFVDGTVSVVGQISSSSASAIFTDGPIEICSVPESGDWTIISDCTLSENGSAPANVIVQNNSVLSIPNGLTLDIVFANFSLMVKSGSGVSIAAGGSVT